MYYASHQLRDDYGVVLTAVSEYGGWIEYASRRLRNNPEIVIAAVNTDAYDEPLEYVSDDLLKNEHFQKRIFFENKRYIDLKKMGY